MPDNETQPTPASPSQPDRELLEQIYHSVERTRKMFLWTLILTIIAFVLPLIGLALAIPYFLSTYVSALSGQLGL